MSLSDPDVLDYRNLKRVIARFADCPLGSQRFDSLSTTADLGEIRKQLEMARECLEMLESGQALRFSGVVDVEPIFRRVRIRGAVLQPAEIKQILHLAEVVGAARQVFKAAGRQFPTLAGVVCSQVGDLSGIVSRLVGKIGPSGEVEDQASPQLRKLRREVSSLRLRICRSLEGLLQTQEAAKVLQDDLITVRNQRFVIPVRTNRRKAFPGVVHGSSSSGLTLFVEPLQSVELNNQLIRLREEVEEEVLRILRELTVFIQKHLIELQSAARVVGAVDFSFAKARFCRQYDCIFPEVNASGSLKIELGRHPLLEMHLKEQGKEIVPISVDLGDPSHVLVISGPNAGGKTVALKTVGILTMMALSGIPVPAVSAEIGLFQQIFADIGDRQSITHDLSTFSSHLGSIRRILDRVRPPALVLLDELGTGTDPAEGAALGTAILEELRSRGIVTIITTHLNGLKRYACQTEGVLNASVEFEQANLRPTYRLIHGIPGNSSGIDMAQRLGLPEPIVDRARRLVSNKEQEIARYAQALSDQLAATAQLKGRLQREQERLRDQRADLEKKQRNLEEAKDREIALCRKQARRRFEKETSRLLAGIQEKFEAVRLKSEVRRRSRELGETELRDLPDAGAANLALLPKKAAFKEGIKAGARVRVVRLGSVGTIRGARGEGQWEVAVGSMNCVLSARELEPLQPDGSDTPRLRLPSAVSVQLRTAELQSNELNLVGCRADEAIRRVDKFLDRAFLASLSPVRLVHGSGMGVLRRAISEWLSGQSYVSEFHPAEINEGGNRVTVVSLNI